MTSTLRYSTLKLNPRTRAEPPAQAKPKPDERKRRRNPVVVGEPVLDELAAALAEAQKFQTELGRQARQLHDIELPAAIAALPDDPAFAHVAALLRRARELREAQRRAFGRTDYWRRKFERSIGDRECASWRVQP